MTAVTRHNTTSDEIDLFALIERSIRFFKKYRWVFIIGALAGLLMGYYFYKKTPRTYKSRMVVHSFLLTNQEQIQIVKNWNELLTKGEHKTLSTILQTPENILKKVKKIKAEEIMQVFSQSNPHGFIIDALVTDNAVLPVLQKGLVHGFETSPYIKERLMVKKEALKELIEKTTAEINKLDSTKGTLENIIGGREHSSASLIIDGSTINRQWVEMNEKLIALKESLKFASSVQLLQGFEAFRRPVGPHLFPWLIIGLFGMLALSYVLALIHAINQGLKARRAEQNLAVEGTP